MGAKDQGADVTAGRWLAIPRTLCFITHGDDVLLLKRGENKRIFPGHYNGVGGHIERDEDPHTSAIREMQEETGLIIEPKAILGIYSDPERDPRGPRPSTVFIVDIVGGELKPGSDAVEIGWFPLDEIDDLPFDNNLVLEHYKKFKQSGGTFWSTKN